MPTDSRRDPLFFEVSTLSQPPGTLLLTAGDDLDSLTVDVAAAHAARVIAGRPEAVVVDLAGRFLDAAGIRALERTFRLAARGSVPLRIVGCPDWLSRLAEVLAVQDLPLCPDLPTALAGLRADLWWTVTRDGDGRATR